MRVSRAFSIKDLLLNERIENYIFYYICNFHAIDRFKLYAAPFNASYMIKFNSLRVNCLIFCVWLIIVIH